VSNTHGSEFEFVTCVFQSETLKSVYVCVCVCTSASVYVVCMCMPVCVQVCICLCCVYVSVFVSANVFSCLNYCCERMT
jgi:hypothetical protein